MTIEQLEKSSARFDPIGGDPVAPRGPFHAQAHQSVLHHSGIQECMDESQQTLDFDVFGDLTNRLTFVEEQRKHRQTTLRRLLRLASGVLLVGGVAYLVFLALADRPVNQTHGIPQATIPVDKKQAIAPADQKQSIAPTGQKQATIPADQQQSIVPEDQKQAMVSADQKQSIAPADQKQFIAPTGQKQATIPADQQQSIVPADQKQAMVPADQKQSIITNDKQQAIILDDKQEAIVPGKQQAVATDDEQQATISKGHCWARWSRSHRVQITCVGTDRERPRR